MDNFSVHPLSVSIRTRICDDNFIGPENVAIDAAERSIWVVDSDNYRISVWTCT